MLPPIVPSTTAWLHADQATGPSGLDAPVAQPSPPVVMSLNTAFSTTPPVVTPGPESLPHGEMIAPFAPLGHPQHPRPAGPLGTRPPGGLPGDALGMSSPFSTDNVIESPFVNQNYDRVLDLFPNANDRQLIERVREAVEQTEVGEDVTDEQWITVRGGGKRITWGGRMDTDTVSWANADEFSRQSNYVEFRRLRLMASGDGYGVYDYQLELEFSPEFAADQVDGGMGDGFGVEVKDAYIGLRDIPVVGYAVIGHFRTPIGLQSLTSSRFVPFMERSLPNRLLPGRELGIAAFNHSPNQNMTWGYGVFFDDLDESRHGIVDDNQGSRFISRLTFTPFYDEATGGASLLHTGIGYAYTRPRLRLDPLDMVTRIRPVRFTARPEIHEGVPLIDTGIIDTQQFQLLNVELAWAHGPLTIQSEGTYAQLDEAGGGSTHVWGSYVEGSWFLTGERRPYDRNFAVFRRVIPYENFWMVRTPGGTQAGLGAWEVAARWSHLNFADVNDQYLHDLTVGLNWYWNPNSRLMFNWIHPFAHNSPEGVYTDSQGDILAARLQVDF